MINSFILLIKSHPNLNYLNHTTKSPQHSADKLFSSLHFNPITDTQHHFSAEDFHPDHENHSGKSTNSDIDSDLEMAARHTLEAVRHNGR